MFSALNWYWLGNLVVGQRPPSPGQRGARVGGETVEQHGLVLQLAAARTSLALSQ